MGGLGGDTLRVGEGLLTVQALVRAGGSPGVLSDTGCPFPPTPGC